MTLFLKGLLTWLSTTVAILRIVRGEESPEASGIVAGYNIANKSYQLNHILVDPASGDVFLAATNHLFRLTSNLELLESVETGPVLDSPSCHASGCDSEEVKKSMTDNINKILVLDPESRKLIVCGSVLQGACQKYRADNITEKPEFIARSIAANDPKASTFAFIGPEHYNPWATSNVLYVGTTFTNNGDYRHDVPAISSRNLFDLDLAEYSFSKQSMLNIDVKYRDHFLVNYIYGFNTTKHSYFVIVQKRSHLPGQEEAGHATRLARTCITDANYNSYTEVTLQCLGSDGVDYNLIQDSKLIRAGRDLARSFGVAEGELVLAGVFSPSRGHTDQPLHRSAFCVFSLQQIEVKFTENMHMCFNGSMKYRDLDYVSGQVLDGQCPKTGAMGNIYDFCEVGLKISGPVPITSHAVVTYPDVFATSLAITTTQNHTVAFIGTSRGWLRKILISSHNKGFEYDRLNLKLGSPILKDMKLNADSRYIYAMSSTRVLKIHVEMCHRHTDCTICLKSNDPYCGWCSLEKRCSIKTECLNATVSSPRWITPGQQCIEFEQIVPDRIPITQQSVVQLTIKTLPDLPTDAKYLCVYGNAPPIDALATPFGLSCMTPSLRDRPTIPDGLDHVSVPLSIRSSETQKDFVSRTFSFYNCGHHQTCMECAKSRWACNWCVYENRCTHNATSCHNTIISGEHVSILHLLQKNPAQLVTHGAGFCPHFRRNEEDILIPNGVPSEIKLGVENIPMINKPGFQCIIEIEGAKMMVPAKVYSNGEIVCQETVYTYEEMKGEYKAQITVVWNKNHYIDKTIVTIYKCEILGSHRDHPDCSLCVTRPPKYLCSWCGNSCVYSKSCSVTPVFECPKPRIDVIHPLQGPIEGGTLLTIEGSNLGLKMDDVKGKISVGNIPCDLVDYAVSVRIVCRTGPAWDEIEASVVVGNNVGFTESLVKFQYKKVSLESVYPSVGPQSGGTNLVISGVNLNIGTSVTAFLDQLQCSVQGSQISSTRLTCHTSRSNGPRAIRTLTVKIDGANRTLSGYPFTYVMDPTIMEIKPLKSFESGGRMLTVHGTSLNSILKPEMLVFLDENPTILNKTRCEVVNPSYMKCPTPPINRDTLLDLRSPRSPHISLRSPGFYFDSSLGLRLGFAMDDVASVRDLAKHFKNLRSQIIYVEDPRYFQFPNEIKLYKGDTLVIEGENLNLASDESDVNVTIGTETCNVTSIALTQLVCIPPDPQPSPTDERGARMSTGLPLVVVRVGTNLRFPIGYLRYDMIKPYTFPPEAVGGIAAGGLFLVLVSLVILFVYRRKSSQAEREYKRIQIQMDTLESNVRQECKQAFAQMCTWDPRRNGAILTYAFADLQTDISDITADLEVSGVPTLSHLEYVMKVFFPGVIEHPILNEPQINVRINGPRTNYDAAMIQFEQLVNNKFFLVAFIDMLESQKTFSIRDKVNVASLLMVILMNKMEYATEVLRALLLRLIDKSVSTKHPQLMLRRTESVVEKMLTNWMALCMYNYLKDRSGSSLFLLYKAIKHQIEKGPVDSLTHEARYSLSEEKLLKEQIDHHPVLIHLVPEEPHYETINYQSYQTLNMVPSELDEKLQCKVLDCDTISQVKAKLLDAVYKNTPFSQRPTIHEVDLEWRHGRGGRVVLSDEDMTSQTVNGWKRLNTLAHYGIKGSTMMSLISRQNDCYTPHVSAVIGTGVSFSLVSGLPVMMNGCPENGHIVNIYHLIPAADENQYLTSKTERTAKAIPEIFLTRLLSTKGTIQKFVDDFFQTVLTVSDQLPPAVKWLFDLLDEAALHHNITDPEVVHAWKSNSLPLRFWVNFIKNPDFIFDVEKPPTVDSCLSVIAQTFMDSCSMSDHRLGKDSPSNKLLFAKDIPRYKEMVSKFYADIVTLPQITDQELYAYMHEISMEHLWEFDIISALKELYIYVHKYNEETLEALDRDPYCNKLHLSHKLENVACTLEGEETSVC